MQPAYPNDYQEIDAAVLQPIASLANGDVLSIRYIPGEWNIVTALADKYSGVQALLLTNTLPSNTDQTFAVLALGQLWTGLLSNYFAGGKSAAFDLKPLAASLGGPGTPTALFCDAYQKQYTTVAEPQIFAELKKTSVATQVSSLPLIIVGQALGAPLAQLAALAFRALRPGIPANLHTAACYTFSTPPMGDANFSNLLLDQNNRAVFNVWAKDVDFFADPPVPFPNATRAGKPQPVLTAAIPTLPVLNNQAVDDPWVEHSGAYYTQLFGSTVGGKMTAGKIESPPAGYSNDLAVTLLQLIAVAYQQTQHDNSPPSPNPVFTRNSYIASGATRWGAIFTDQPNQRIFVVFRGELSLEESVNALSQDGATSPAYLPAGCALTPGVEQIYAALRTDLRTKAAAALASVGGTKVYMAGHGLGGVLANIAALDFATQGGGLTAPIAIYTFGAPPSGDDNFFQPAYDAQFAGAAPTSYQLTRAGDPFPALQYAGTAWTVTVGANTVLTGSAPLYDDNINHSLTSYIVLLKPT
jgi:hypothetical protein